MTAPNGNGQQGTGVAERPKSNIIAAVEHYAESIVKLAPRGMTADYYIEELRLYLSKPGKDGKPSPLLLCEPNSIARGVLSVAQTGLSLGVTCDLLPFGRTCVFNAHYKGLIGLALQAGTRAINMDVVYDDDLTWDYQKGTEFYLKHKRGPRKGNITDFYALAEVKVGSFAFEVMTKAEVETFKAKFSKQWNRTPIEDCLWYGKKTAFRQLSKVLPTNARFATALAHYARDEDDIPDGDFEILPDGKSPMEHAIMDPRPDAAPSTAPPASSVEREPEMTDEQIVARDRELEALVLGR